MPSAATLRSGRPPRCSSAAIQTPLRPGDPGGDDAELGAGVDQRLLDAADVVDDEHVVGQRDDRVADQLAGSVEGDLAAAVDVDDRDVVAERPLVGLGALAGGEHRRVLEHQHRGGAAGDDPRVHLALQVPGRQVVHRLVAEADGAEVDLAHAPTLRRAGEPVRDPSLWTTADAPRGICGRVTGCHAPSPSPPLTARSRWPSRWRPPWPCCWRGCRRRRSPAAAAGRPGAGRGRGAGAAGLGRPAGRGLRRAARRGGCPTCTSPAPRPAPRTCGCCAATSGAGSGSGACGCSCSAVSVVDRLDDRWRLAVTDRVAGGVAVGRGRRLALPRDHADTHVVTLMRGGDHRWRVAAGAGPADPVGRAPAGRACRDPVRPARRRAGWTSVGCSKVNPSASSLAGSTRVELSSSEETVPASVSSTAAGTGRNAGRCSLRPNCLAELRVGRRVGRGDVVGPLRAVVGDEVRRGAHPVAQRERREVLRPRPDRAAQAGLEHRQQQLDGPAPAVQHDTGAHRRDAGPGLGPRARWPPPSRAPRRP